MDGFNPLDLLASAAELQQKHDDGPERIIITRQRRNNVAKSPLVMGEQKENREMINNNNISKNKPSVVIVKKIKKVDINPELEKMLDEHNYGNAKRNNVRIDKASESALEINGRKKKRLDLGNYNNSEQFIQTTTTEGHIADKITTVANTSTQPSDSECIHVKCKVDCTDKGVCSNRICTSKHETEENKCSKIDQGTKYDLQGQTKVDLNLGEQNTHNTVIHACDNLSRTPDTLIMKYDNKHEANCDVSVYNSELGTNQEDGLKLDEQTGEFFTKSGEKISTKDSINKDGESFDTTIIIDKGKDLSVQKDLNVEDVVTEMGSAKTVTISNKALTKSTSEPKKMPYVKVIPSDVSEPGVDKMPQTLVINITRGRNSGDTLTTTSDLQNLPDTGSDSKSSDTGIIRSLLAKNKLCEMNKDDLSLPRAKPVVLSIKSPKLQFELPHCSTRKLGENSTSCDSLKELEMSDSMCTHDSSSSVHLLSPDCRNPDSMGIAESPVTHNVSELSYSGDNTLDSSFCAGKAEQPALTHCQDYCETEAVGKSPAVGGRFSAFTSSPLHSNISNNTLDLDTSSVETISDARELSGDCSLLLTEKADHCDNSANELVNGSECEKNLSVFRFDSDHCYAGMPGKINTTRVSIENENSIQSEEGYEPPTPLGSMSELSQDSGYEDVTQSPDVEKPALPGFDENVEKPSTVKNLVPVLVSVNSSGCLTVHDTNLTKTLGGQVFLPENMKVITGTNFTPISQAPLILSPVTVGKSTSVLNEAPKLAPAKPESIIGLISPKTPELNIISNDSQDVSPPKYGKFRIGTFASFSNTGVGLESPIKLNSPVKVQNEEKPKRISPSAQSRPSSAKSGKSSPVVDTLGTLVQKVKSSLSPVSQVELNGIDHIQHDHDYCTKNLMPSVISSFLEARLLSKETPRGKVTHTKGKKTDSEYSKSESKSGKRKRNAASLSKEEIHDEFDVDSESDTHSIPEPLRPKYRSEKLIEPKRKDPKVKITGSSNFQDQFVYFMNTKKRSRRRESKDMPLPFGTDRVFIPPKPGDIVVPHLTDQDIENLRIRSKQTKITPGNMCSNSLRNEFMAAKLSNGTFSATQPAESVDDEKNIINTILSLENEDLSSPVQSEPPPYNESMELYGQGLNTDIMNLFPEQMNLTPEQMDLLYSAVDEVQNSSPGLVGAEKLVSTETSDAAFQFPIAAFENSGITSSPVSNAGNCTSKDQSGNEGETKPETRETNTTAKETEGTQNEAKSMPKTEEQLEASSDENSKILADVSGDKKPVNSLEHEDSENTQTKQNSDKVIVTSDQISNSETQVSTDGDKQTIEGACVDDSVTKVTPVVNEGNINAVAQTVGDKTVTPVCDKTVTAVDDKTVTPVDADSDIDIADSVVTNGNLHQSTLKSVAVSFSNSGSPDASTPDGTVSSPEKSNDRTKIVNSVGPNQEAFEQKILFQSPSSGSVPTSFESVISSVNSTSITSEISLPQIDKSLDLLSNDFRLDKGDLFPDTSVTENAVQSPVVQQPPVQVDYNAPWIVTVSMYWNDLPAIMINNQPFVRLVDIHKQILPAKDTGILKKRCQLMGIEVENCSEMQRYFLVQYGRAFNSKSTLIISKVDAKVLIGYYVDPQPRAVRPEDHHKSIIDHRREQLRRIALARRAAVRAQRVREKKDEPDPREIRETPPDDVDHEQAIPSSAHALAKSTEAAKVAGQFLDPLVQTDGGRLQRATRHKKINFLEMLRGDPSKSTGDDEAANESEKKQSNKVLSSLSRDGKRKRVVKEKKVKIVKYTIETDSSEETESVESDSSSESYDSESTSGSDIQVMKKPAKQRKISPSLIAKAKSRIKPVPKTYNKGSLKVKIGLKKSRPMATSTPVAVQVNKPTSLSKLTSINQSKSRKESPPQCYSPPIIVDRGAMTLKSSDINKDNISSHTNKNIAQGVETSDCDITENVEEFTDRNETELPADQNIKTLDSVMTSRIELKISPTLPEDILDASEEPDAELDSSSESKVIESVNIQTDSCSVENEDETDVSSCNTNEGNLKQNGSKCFGTNESESKSLMITDGKSEEQAVKSKTGENESRSQSPVVTDNSLSLMKRKESVQISNDETPIRIVHRDASPQTQQRTRSQLGELFVGHYNNKKSPCVRCYTCRKMLSVDNFLRHLHDISGVLLPINLPRTIDLSDTDISESERKYWDSFLRKKELFDNNQLPSPDIVRDSLMYNVDGDRSHSFSETGSSGNQKSQSGPRIITTPVSPLKRGKIVRKNKQVTGNIQFISNQPTSHKQVNRKSTVLVESTEGVRTSSRKRKVKHLYGFEDNSFKKFPRLMKNAVVDEENTSE